MSTIKIKVSPELFESWGELSDTLKHRTRVLGGIVQNDMEVTTEQVQEWLGGVESLKKDLVEKIDDLTKKTAQHIMKINEGS